MIERVVHLSYLGSVTHRISEVKQPYGGYVNPNKFDVTHLINDEELYEFENVHSSVVGLVVDYMTRFMTCHDVYDAFAISVRGFIIAERNGFADAVAIGKSFIEKIKGLDDESIINACKLVTFDVWRRHTDIAATCKTYADTNPDAQTINNIRIMIKRSLVFFEKYGPVVENEFTFYPEHQDVNDYDRMIATGEGIYGGYTATVNGGDGDFLTEDTMWDFKVSKSKPTSKHTLQLLMYWVMGQHSGQSVYKSITKLGIFNPRLNKVYILNISDIPLETIKTVETEVICYK